jgi:general secretion pathway protein K
MKARRPDGQGGIALITAILVVALASLAATAILVSAQMAIQRTANLRDSEQAWWMALGVESWILGILREDAADNNHDSLDEPWAQPVDYLPVDEGFVSGRILDEQGRFNLNNLASTKHPQVYREQFQRLLAGLNVQYDPGVVAAIIDWIDADALPGFPGGAEDLTYLNLNPPYRAANQPFVSVTELLAVHGITRELYQALTRCEAPDGSVQSCVTALPMADTPVNVNTALPQVLRALSQQTDDAKLRAFIETRLEEPKTNVDDFIQEAILGADAKREMLSVGSQFFSIRGQIVVGSSRLALYSLIHRPAGGAPFVLARSADAE